MIALYVRVSRADEQEGESDSVTTQRLLLQSFATRLARSEGLADVEMVEFIDDGYTGMNTARPGLQEMLALCYAGLVEMVVVRDFSRLARDYVDLGVLVENVFPMLGVRLVSLEEQFDSRSDAGVFDADLLRGIVGIANSYYSRDISIRVRTSVASSWRRGVHVQAFAPYGYLYDSTARGHLRPDPVARDYVVRLFELAAEGNRPSVVACIAEGEGIPTPAAYARKAGIRGKGACYNGVSMIWNSRKVRYVLQREEYVGVHVGGLTRQLAVGRGSPKRSLAPHERIRVEDAHEPLVTRDLFDAAQCAMRHRNA